MKPPIVKIDNEFYQDMTPEKLKDIILNLVKNKK
ncbi:NAD(P)H-dependent oxidoreductase subunit E [Thermosipho affectus]|nr:NAD(P)H-dependent oxidoreductase subunit E [Thermosipho affectus]